MTTTTPSPQSSKRKGLAGSLPALSWRSKAVQPAALPKECDQGELLDDSAASLQLNRESVGHGLGDEAGMPGKAHCPYPSIMPCLVPPQLPMHICVWCVA